MTLRSRFSVVWEIEAPSFGSRKIATCLLYQNFVWLLELSFDASNIYRLSITSGEGAYIMAVRNTTFSTTVHVITRPGSLELMQSRRNIQGLETGVTIWESGESDILKANPYFGSKKIFTFYIFLDIDDGESKASFESFFVKPSKEEESPLYIANSHCLDGLSGDLCKLLDEESTHDVKLKCGDRTVGAHKVILSTRSEVFARMLDSDMAEGRTGVVDIQDMDSGDLVQFIRYLYTGTLPELTTDTAMRFYEAGDKYAVGALVERCCNFLTDHLTPENVCKVLLLADAPGHDSFREVVIDYILREKIPLQKEHWLIFCDGYPKLANEILNRFLTLHFRNK